MNFKKILDFVLSVPFINFLVATNWLLVFLVEPNQIEYDAWFYENIHP